MTYEPPHPDPKDDDEPMTSPYWPPGRPDDVVEFGGPQRLGGSRRLAIGAAVAAVAMVGGAGIAYAANGSPATAGTTAASSPSPSASASPTGPPAIHCRLTIKGSTKSMKQCPPFGDSRSGTLASLGGFLAGSASRWA